MSEEWYWTANDECWICEDPEPTREAAIAAAEAELEPGTECWTGRSAPIFSITDIKRHVVRICSLCDEAKPDPELAGAGLYWCRPCADEAAKKDAASRAAEAGA